MAVTLNASTSSGFIATSDTSGVLELQNNGTTRMKVNSSGVSFAAQPLIGGIAPPAFSAYHSTTQSLGQDVITKVLFNTEVFDTNNNFASSRFTPTVAGYYQFSCGIRANNNPQIALHVQLRLNNSTTFAQGQFTNTGLAAFMSSCSGLAYLNGTTDYVEVYTYNGTNGSVLESGIGVCYFQGVLVRGA